MKFYDRAKGLLLAAFSASTPEKAPAPMPEKIMMPLAWPAYLANHVSVKTSETMDTQICAAKWAVVTDIMQSILNPSAMNRDHREFIGHMNALRGNIMISNKDMFEVSTHNLVTVYNHRHIFDEISRILSNRETDLSNVTPLPGVAMPDAAADVAIVSKFKDKYIEMMETAMLPYLQPGWTKENAQKAPENKGTAPWGGTGRRPF